jgi:hypothetical protein
MHLRPGGVGPGTIPDRSNSIDLNKDDLADWLDRQVAMPVIRDAAKGKKTQLAKRAAQEIWGANGPPSALPPQHIFQKVADQVQKQHRVEIGKSQVLRALGLKKN